MNAIANIDSRVDGLGWTPSIERLRADYETARAGGELDPWSVIEAECWLDLIEAELSAKSTQADPDLCARLVGWRQEIASLLVRMRALGAASPPKCITSFPGASVSQRVRERRGPERPGNLAMPPLSQRHGLLSQPNVLEEAS